MGCPFYRSDDGKGRITCEGIVDRSSTILSFVIKGDYLRQLEVFCCRYYENCEVYQMLMEKYKEEYMEKSDVIRVDKPHPDSQYLLRPCRKCKGDNAAYVQYNGRGGAKWRVECFDCGHKVDKEKTVKHDAQLAWNMENRDA